MSAEAREQLLERAIAANAAYYNTQRNYTFDGRTFPAYAEFHTHGEQYVLTKRAKLWEVNTHDYLFFDSVEQLDVEGLKDAISYMTTSALRKVSPGPNHMSSAISLIIISDSVTDDAIKLAKKTKFRKNYKLSIHGWSDLRLAVVDLSRPAGRQVYCNTFGKQMAEMLKANLQLINKK